MTSLIVLARVLVAVGQALQEADSDQLQPAQGAKARKAKHKAAPETTPQATPSGDMSWEDPVEPCPIAEATRATELLKVARAKLGRPEAQLLWPGEADGAAGLRRQEAPGLQGWAPARASVEAEGVRPGNRSTSETFSVAYRKQTTSW